MRSCDTLLLSYQNYLLGETERFRFVPVKMTKEQTSEKALRIVKWVIEELLEWTPQQAMDHFGDKEVNAYKLKGIIKKIIIPEEMGHSNYQYILSLIFPDKIKYNPSEGIIKMWDEILSGERKRFQYNIFNDEEGKKRACILLNEFNNRYLPVSGIEELYREYSNSAKINKLFGDAKIYNVLSNLHTYPIGLLHEMIKYLYPGQEDDYLYAIYLYRSIENNISITQES